MITLKMAHRALKFCTAEMEKLQQFQTAINAWVDHGLELRHQVDINIANLATAMEAMAERIAAEQAGDDCDTWLPGAD